MDSYQGKPMRTSKFDRADKPEEWHTAFYYLAEHVRFLTDGSINHKVLYSLVGTKGRYANHPNPVVRRRTAADLSRLVHSKAYAADMRKRFDEDSEVFDAAAQEVCTRIAEAGVVSERDLGEYLARECWPDVLVGLEHERASWRSSLDLARVTHEAALVFGDGLESSSIVELEPALQIAALFRFVSFGYLTVDRARGLLGDTCEFQPIVPDAIQAQQEACLTRFADLGGRSVAGFWVLPKDRPFIIGRYTDSDSVETDMGISRRHASISFVDGVWLFEDFGSKNGSIIERDGSKIEVSSVNGSHARVKLAGGDAIVLAGKSCYRFGAFRAL